jgi:hypothetical protein
MSEKLEMKENWPKLNTPPVLKMLATAFILAPAGNLYLSFRSMGIPHYYMWQRLHWLLQMVSTGDWVRLGLTFVAGVMLFSPRKLSWALAMLTLVLATGYSLLDVIYAPQVTYLRSQYAFIFAFSSISVLIILSYFRYPYLDRRDSWWGIARRYSLALPVSIRPADSQDWQPGTLENFSVTGAKVGQVRGTSYSVGQKVELLLSDFEGDFIVRAIAKRCQAGTIGMQFSGNPVSIRFRVISWIKRRKKQTPQQIYHQTPSGGAEECA